jgi:multisubunit Na+/H+ antiporter MnhF subunit
MNAWLWAALIMLPSFVPAGIVCFHGQTEDRLVGLEFTGVLVTFEMILLAEAFHRSIYFDLPLTLAFLAFGSGLVFARFVQRWL